MNHEVSFVWLLSTATNCTVGYRYSIYIQVDFVQKLCFVPILYNLRQNVIAVVRIWVSITRVYRCKCRLHNPKCSIDSTNCIRYKEVDFHSFHHVFRIENYKIDRVIKSKRIVDFRIKVTHPTIVPYTAVYKLTRLRGW